jgi:hypothetical protein
VHTTGAMTMSVLTHTLKPCSTQKPASFLRSDSAGKLFRRSDG